MTPLKSVEKPKTEAKTAFGKSLKQYGKWKEKVNVDRFIILTFLTAKEKMDFAEKAIGDPEAVYIDGKEWTLKFKG